VSRVEVCKQIDYRTSLIRQVRAGRLNFSVKKP
jgi:hypothetical protein